MAPNADIQVGDVLITSGMDGVYPAGLAVAKVVQVESSAAGAFGRVVCQPLAGIDRNRQLLILMAQPDLLPRPPAEPPKVVGKKSGLPKMAPLNVPPLPAAQPKAPPPPAVNKGAGQ
jgi:rod shape-determining protein MreC